MSGLHLVHTQCHLYSSNSVKDNELQGTKGAQRLLGRGVRCPMNGRELPHSAPQKCAYPPSAVPACRKTKFKMVRKILFLREGSGLYTFGAELFKKESSFLSALGVLDIFKTGVQKIKYSCSAPQKGEFVHPAITKIQERWGAQDSNHQFLVERTPREREREETDLS